MAWATFTVHSCSELKQCTSNYHKKVGHWKKKHVLDDSTRQHFVPYIYLIVQFRIKNYRWIQTLTTHSCTVSLDLKKNIHKFLQVSVWNLNIHDRQSNKQVFFSLNILLQMEAKPVKMRLHFFNSAVLANSKVDWPLSSYPSLCFKARLSAKPLIRLSLLVLMQIKLISLERFCTLPRSESESFWNSKMAY